MKREKKRIWSVVLSTCLVAAFAVLAVNLLLGPTETEAVQVTEVPDVAAELDSASPLAELSAGNVIGRRGRNFGARGAGSPSLP